MRTLDLLILFAYLIGTVLFGSWFSRRQRRGMKDYFVSGKSVPWWVIMASVVSTETSSATFVSVPGLAFTGNFTFLQLVVAAVILALPGSEAAARSWVPALDPTLTIILISVLAMGVATIVFSYFGG